MDIPADILARFNVKPASEKNEYWRNKSTADEIYFYFKKKIPFLQLMRLVETKGRRFVRQCWREAVDAKPKDELSLFLRKVSQIKPILK